VIHPGLFRLFFVYSVCSLPLVWLFGCVCHCLRSGFFVLFVSDMRSCWFRSSLLLRHSWRSTFPFVSVVCCCCSSRSFFHYSPFWFVWLFLRCGLFSRSLSSLFCVLILVCGLVTVLYVAFVCVYPSFPFGCVWFLVTFGWFTFVLPLVVRVTFVCCSFVLWLFWILRCGYVYWLFCVTRCVICWLCRSFPVLYTLCRLVRYVVLVRCCSTLVPHHYRYVAVPSL